MIARTVAPAKLNLVLDVGSLREDGYHDLRSVFVAIDLVDDVSVERSQHTTLCVGGESEGVPAGADNLALRAASLVAERFGTGPLAIGIHKRIPAAGGLGGGSSDAAAVIRSANALCGLGLGPEAQARLGLELGSDVPFFAIGGSALVEGRGERVTPLVDADLDFVLYAAPASLGEKTRVLFAALDALERPHHNRVDRLLSRWPAVVADQFGNDFEAVAFEAFAGLADVRDRMVRCGTQPRLSGAGPTLFAVCTDAADAEVIVTAAAASGLALMHGRSLSRSESVAVEVE